ncbi:MAG: hypothetical protein ABEK59_02305 [Halobacteria archaeon]
MEKVHISTVRSCVYCGRQAYYRIRQSGLPRVPDETRVLRELSHRYPCLMGDPEEALSLALEKTDVSPKEIDLDPYVIRDGLEGYVGTELWSRIIDPLKSVTNLEGERFHGYVNKLIEGDQGVSPTVVKTGRAPRNGVWKPDRVEVAAAVEAVADCFEDPSGNGYVEYVGSGKILKVDVNPLDRRRVRRVLDTLDDARDGHPPSRTKNRDKCGSCRFQDDCGVETGSLYTRLKDTLLS